MIQPTSDVQSSGLLSHQLHTPPAPHSIPVFSSPAAATLSSPPSGSGRSAKIAHDRATDFAAHSWDLATGGLKTLTAKRELPPQLDRRSSGKLLETTVTSAPTQHSYTFALVIIACVLVMLVSGGIVLFMIVQP